MTFPPLDQIMLQMLASGLNLLGVDPFFAIAM